MTHTISTEKLAQYLLTKKGTEQNKCCKNCINDVLIDISLGKLNDVKPWLGAIARDKVTPI